MSMMYSAGLMLALMAFLITVVGGVLLAVRIYGAREVRGDQPHGPTKRSLQGDHAPPA